jgi:hypothetical protein
MPMIEKKVQVMMSLVWNICDLGVCEASYWRQMIKLFDYDLEAQRRNLAQSYRWIYILNKFNFRDCNPRTL